LQIRALREHAVQRGWTIALHVKEVGSGASERQLLEKLLEAACARYGNWSTSRSISFP